MNDVVTINRRNGPAPVIVIAGATASGKSALCHELANRWQARGERVVIVNMDAFQMYRDFDIGTAKPSSEALGAHDYRFIDVCDPAETFDAQSFGSAAREVVAAEVAAGARVLVVGGSGLYMRSLVHGLDALPVRHDELRHFFRETARVFGAETLHKWLQRLDPKRAAAIHPRDLVRTERALEIFFVTGKTMGDQTTQKEAVRHQSRLFSAYVVALIPPMSVLERRIRQRTEALIGVDSEGPWLTEVRSLLGRYGDHFFSLQATRALGYTEIGQAVRKKPTSERLQARELAALVDEIALRTRQYAKRQKTWLGSAAVDWVVGSEEDRLAFLRHMLSP